MKIACDREEWAFIVVAEVILGVGGGLADPGWVCDSNVSFAEVL